MMFHVLSRNSFPPSAGVNAFYLKVDHWNDFSFVTSFELVLHDETGELVEIGAVKIGFKGQTTEQPTYSALPPRFMSIPDGFFSLGQSVEFYKKIATLSPASKESLLKGLADIVYQPELILQVENEEVFGVSLLRSVSLSVVRGQFARVLEGFAERTDFRFAYSQPNSEEMGGVDLDFNVKALSTPSTNIHALIGRNGVGKTTLLNGMVSAVTDPNSQNKFVEEGLWGLREKIAVDYFSSLVSVSFSAFDPFQPPLEQPDPAKGTCYFYVGLKSDVITGGNKSVPDLREDCAKSLISCFDSLEKSRRWVRAMEKLGSDENFASMDLGRLKVAYDELQQHSLQADSPEFRARYSSRIRIFLDQMSSGHFIVLLITAYLVSRVEEKTLILLDEPESHLHPPLLSAFIRALADLLHDRNGVAIVATHSPVVLQEIPRSCVWKITRVGLSISKRRPTIETFGENLGLLTSEVFGLEVERSGFHALLASDVGAGKTYDEIVAEYGGQLGMEGRSILGALIASRDGARY